MIRPMSRRLKLVLAGAALLILIAGSPLVLREFGPTIHVHVRSNPEPLAIKVWYVERDGGFWIRCGDYDRKWCRDLLQHPSAEIGSPGAWRPVHVRARPGKEYAARFQTWLEEDHPVLGFLPRLRALDRALVFRLTPRG